MPAVNSKRTSPLLPAVFVAAGAACLWKSLVAGQAESTAFLRGFNGAQAPRPQVARHAFVDEFQEWRSSLTEDEQMMLGRQSKYMFNKTYRGSDEFDGDIAADKVEKIGTILSKYFENEADEYKKERLAKRQDPNALFEKSGGKTMDMTLTNNIETVDRRADRRYYWSMLRMWEAKKNGKQFADPAVFPREVDAPSPDMGVLKEMLNELSPDMKKDVEAEMKDNMPKGKLMVPETVMTAIDALEDKAEELAKEAGVSKQEYLDTARHTYALEWAKAFDRVDTDARMQAAFYAGQTKKSGQTKADVIKMLWPELSKVSKKPLPPVSEELLEDLAGEPAFHEHNFKNKFAVADTLYKSEAVDPFGTKFLLGVFETEKEAKSAFDAWNKAYEDSREKQLEKMAQWAKRQQAQLDESADAQDRVFQAAQAAA